MLGRKNVLPQNYFNVFGFIFLMAYQTSGLFRAKSMLVGEQLWYDLIRYFHSLHHKAKDFLSIVASYSF